MQSVHILTTTSWQYDSRSRPLCTPSLGVGFVQEQMGSAKGVDGIFPKLQAFRRTEVWPLRLEIRGIALKAWLVYKSSGRARTRATPQGGSIISQSEACGLCDSGQVDANEVDVSLHSISLRINVNEAVASFEEWSCHCRRDTCIRSALCLKKFNRHYI